MAVLTQERTEVSGGLLKEIDEGAMDLIFQNLQRFQYQYPVKSTIRETVSNSLDSIKERDVALAILRGEAAVEDYYESGEGAVYKDSRFDRSYYDPWWLGSSSYVDIVYHEGGELGKDSVSISDEGVGLGGDRLRGSFNLGYSSKRLSKIALGKFGIGAKSALSTGIPCYQLLSRYNGREYAFNIYNHKFESTVPKFDIEAGVLQECEIWTDKQGHSQEIYYKPTGCKNGVTVSFTVKKHHKQQYLDAVTGQLLYFPNVRLFIEDPYGSRSQIPVAADILYEDDLVVMSRNAPYSKPHILLNGMNYGYVDFRELELEDKLGNIGLKLDPEHISINPSRESLVWDDNTRESVTGHFKKVVSIAEETISRELKERDFLAWMKVCASIRNSSWESRGDDTILGRLAKVIDTSKVELRYPVDPRFKFSYDLFKGLSARRVTVTSHRKGGKLVTKVEYMPASIENVTSLPIYIQGEESTSNRKNRYLSSQHSQGFILLKLDKIPECREGIYGQVLPGDIPDSMETKDAEKTLFGHEKEAVPAREKIACLYNFILASKGLLWYKNAEVPDGFKGSESEEEEEEETKSEAASLSAEERRKSEGLITLRTPRQKPAGTLWGDRSCEMQSVEAPVNLIDAWSNPEVYWANQDSEDLLRLAADILPAQGSDMSLDDWRMLGYRGACGYSDYNRMFWFYENSPVRLLSVSKQNSRYFQDFKHITRFFKEIKQGVITMGDALVKWNTARLIRREIDKLEFLSGFGQLDPQRAARYQGLVDYLNTNGEGPKFNQEAVKQLEAHLDNVGKFQLFVREFPDDKEAIAEMAKSLFHPEEGVEIKDGMAIDTAVYDSFLALLDWAEPVRVMLNMVAPLIEDNTLEPEQEEEIRNYFRYRNCEV